MFLGNCLSVLYVASCCHFGYTVVYSLVENDVDYIAVLGTGSMVGMVFGAWTAYLLNLYARLSLKFGLSNVVLLVILSIPFRFVLAQRKGKKRIPPWYSVVASVVIPSLFLFWFIWFGLYRNEVETRGACYGDLPFHLNLIASFAYGCNSQRRSVFDLVTPFQANVFLAYPFISNFYSAFLLKCFKASGHACIVIPSMVCGFSLFAVFAGVVRTFSRHEGPCAIAPWLFLFTGGLGFVQWICHKELRGGFYVDFVHGLGNGKTGSWFQTIIHILLPQRASLHSIPIAWAIILLLMQVGHSDKPKPRVFLCIGILVACLPQVQPHSVIACAEWGVFYALLSFFPISKRKTKAMFINYGCLALVALALGPIQMLPYFDRTKHGFWSIKKLWILERHKTMLSMWWNSLGVTFVLSTFHGPAIMTTRQWRYYIPSLIVWLLGNRVIYQPWHMDNTKIFNAAWIPLAIAAASNFLHILFMKGIFGKILMGLLMFFACFSGLLAANMALTQMYPLWQPNDLRYELANFAKSRTRPKSIWILDPWHAHPVTTLAGRQSLRGYDGWSSSHGISDDGRRRIINALMRHPNITYDVDQLGVEFVCLKLGDKNGLKFAGEPSPSKWIPVFENQRYKVYQRNRTELARSLKGA